MLAVAAAYPGLASRWLDGLVRAQAWAPPMVTDSTNESSEPEGWHDLARALESMKAGDFARFDEKQVKWWIPKVRRYSF